MLVSYYQAESGFGIYGYESDDGQRELIWDGRAEPGRIPTEIPSETGKPLVLRYRARHPERYFWRKLLPGAHRVLIGLDADSARNLANEGFGVVMIKVQEASDLSFEGYAGIREKMRKLFTQTPFFDECLRNLMSLRMPVLQTATCDMVEAFQAGVSFSEEELPTRPGVCRVVAERVAMELQPLNVERRDRAGRLIGQRIWDQCRRIPAYRVVAREKVSVPQRHETAIELETEWHGVHTDWDDSLFRSIYYVFDDYGEQETHVVGQYATEEEAVENHRQILAQMQDDAQSGRLASRLQKLRSEVRHAPIAKA